MRVILAVGIAAALAGCVVHAHPVRHEVVYVEEERYRPAPAGNVVVVERVHVHDDYCGHYWYNGAWYLHAGHRHGAGCGHVFHDGHWVMAGAVVVKQGHVHDAHCGHYCHGGTWYYMHGHRHGTGCGHHWDGHMWIAVKF